MILTVIYKIQHNYANALTILFRHLKLDIEIFVEKALQYVNALRAERSGKAVKTTVLDQVAGGTVSYRCIYFSHSFVGVFLPFRSIP